MSQLAFAAKSGDSPDPQKPTGKHAYLCALLQQLCGHVPWQRCFGWLPKLRLLTSTSLAWVLKLLVMVGLPDRVCCSGFTTVNTSRPGFCTQAFLLDAGLLIWQ